MVGGAANELVQRHRGALSQMQTRAEDKRLSADGLDSNGVDLRLNGASVRTCLLAIFMSTPVAKLSQAWAPYDTLALALTEDVGILAIVAEGSRVEPTPQFVQAEFARART